MILVLDASVIIKWFNKEEHSDIALRIREDFYKGEHEIVVPDLVLYEISNALRYNNEFSVDDVAKAVDSLIDMELTIIVPSKEIIKKAIETARKENITIYDAIYIALAKEIGAVFVTAENKLGRLKNAKILKDFYADVQ